MLITQAIGFIAFAFGVIAYSQKDDTKLIKTIIVQNFLLIVHFILLGRYTGALMNGVLMTRNIICLKNKRPFLAPIFLAFFIGFGYFSYEVWQDSLTIIASVVSTLGYFFAGGIRLRGCLLTANILWVVHNAVSFSIGPMFMEIFMGLANIRTIWALYKDKKNPPHTPSVPLE